jgi:hypothetical protein
MATWIGLGDNTELFWAVLSHRVPRGREERGRSAGEEGAGRAKRKEWGGGRGRWWGDKGGCEADVWVPLEGSRDKVEI